MGVRDILITGVTSKLPGDYGPLTDDEMRRDVQRRPGSVAPAARVVGAVQTGLRSPAGPDGVQTGLPAGVVTEYRFHARRRWRFDYAWPEQMLALEIEGGVWSGGRHVRGKGFLGDMEKYNAAALAGWRVLRVTPGQLVDGSAARLVRRALERRV